MDFKSSAEIDCCSYASCGIGTLIRVSFISKENRRSERRFLREHMFRSTMDTVEEESILDDIGEDNYSDDDGFDEEEVPPLEVSSARRNRPPTATRRAETTLPSSPPPPHHNDHCTTPVSDDDSYQQDDTFEDEDSDAAHREPNHLCSAAPGSTGGSGEGGDRIAEDPTPPIVVTREPSAGLTQDDLREQRTPGDAAMLRSPETLSGIHRRSATSESSEMGDQEEYDDAETFDLFDMTTQSHHQMFDIASALLTSVGVSSSLEKTPQVHSNNTNQPQNGGSPSPAVSPSTGSSLFQRRQHEISKRRAELLSAVYTQSYKLLELLKPPGHGDEHEDEAALQLSCLVSLQAALQDFVSSPLFSSDECIELLLGPIIVQGDATTLPPSVLAVVVMILRCCQRGPSGGSRHDVVAAAAASLIVVLRFKESLLVSLIRDGLPLTGNADDDSDHAASGAGGFASLASRWGWLQSLFVDTIASLGSQKLTRSIYSDLLPHFAALSMLERLADQFPVDVTWGSFLLGVRCVTSPPLSHSNDDDMGIWRDATRFWSGAVTKLFGIVSTGQLMPLPVGSCGANGGKRCLRRLVGAMVSNPTTVDVPPSIASICGKVGTPPSAVVASVTKLILQHQVLPLFHIAISAMKGEECARDLNNQRIISWELGATAANAALEQVRCISTSFEAASSALEGDERCDEFGASLCCLYVSMHELLVSLCPYASTMDSGRLKDGVVEEIPNIEVLCDTDAICKIVSGHQWIELINATTTHLQSNCCTKRVFPGSATVVSSTPEAQINASAHVLSLLMSAVTHYFDSALESSTPLDLLNSLLAIVVWGQTFSKDNVQRQTPISVLVTLNDVVVTLNSLLVAAGGFFHSPKLRDEDMKRRMECTRVASTILTVTIETAKLIIVELSMPCISDSNNSRQLNGSGATLGKSFKDALESSQRRRSSSSMLPMAASAVFPSAAAAHSRAGGTHSPHGSGSDDEDNMSVHSAWLQGVNAQSTVLSLAALSMTNLLQLFREETGGSNPSSPWKAFSGPPLSTAEGRASSEVTEDEIPSAGAEEAAVVDAAGRNIIRLVLPHVFDLLELLLFPSELLMLERTNIHVSAPAAAVLLVPSPSLEFESIGELTDRVVVSAVLLVGSVLSDPCCADDPVEPIRLLLRFAAAVEQNLGPQGTIGPKGVHRRRRSSGQHPADAGAASLLRSRSSGAVPVVSQLLADVLLRVLMEPTPQLVENYAPSSLQSLSDLAMLGVTCARLGFVFVDRVVSETGNMSDVEDEGSRFAEGFTRLYRSICCRCSRWTHSALSNDELAFDVTADHSEAIASLATVFFERAAMCLTFHEVAFHTSPTAQHARDHSTGAQGFVTAIRSLLGGAFELLEKEAPTSQSSTARAALLTCDAPRTLSSTWKTIALQKRDVALVTQVDYCAEVARFLDALYGPLCSTVTANTESSNALDDLELLWHREVLPWLILEIGGSNVLLPALQAIREERKELAAAATTRRRSSVSETSCGMPKHEGVDVGMSIDPPPMSRDVLEGVLPFASERLGLVVEREVVSRERIGSEWQLSWLEELERPHATLAMQRSCVRSFLDNIVEVAASEASAQDHHRGCSREADGSDSSTQTANLLLTPADASQVNVADVERMLHNQRVLFLCAEREGCGRTEIQLEAVLMRQSLAVQLDTIVSKKYHEKIGQSSKMPPEEESPLELQHLQTSPMLLCDELLHEACPPMANDDDCSSSPGSAATSSSAHAAALAAFQATMDAAAKILVSSAEPSENMVDSVPEHAVPEKTPFPCETAQNEQSFSALLQEPSSFIAAGCSRSAIGVTSFSDETASTASLILQVEGLMDAMNIPSGGMRQPSQVDSCVLALNNARSRSLSVDRSEKCRAASIIHDLQSIKARAISAIHAVHAREATLDELHLFVAKYERNPQFFSAGLVDSILTTFVHEMKSSSIKVVEAINAWRLGYREYYSRWSSRDTCPMDGGGCGDDSFVLPTSHSALVTDWSSAFRGAHSAAGFCQTWDSDRTTNATPPPQNNNNNNSSSIVSRPGAALNNAAPTVFLYKGVNYLQKMKEDLNFLSSSGVGDFLHIEVHHNVVLMDKKRVVQEKISESSCRGRNFFARLSAPKGTLAISRAAGHLDPDEYGIKELQKATEDERSINVWFRSQTAAERQVVPPPPPKNGERRTRAPIFNLFRVVVPHNWRTSMEEPPAPAQQVRPLSALAGPSAMEKSSKGTAAKSPPNRPMSAALTRKEHEVAMATTGDAANSPMDMFQSLSKTTQPPLRCVADEPQSLASVSKIRNRLRSIHARVPSSADYQTRLSRRHPLQRFAALDRTKENDDRNTHVHHHAAGRAAAAAVGLRPNSPNLHIPLAASGLVVPSTVKTRRGSLIEGGRYSSAATASSMLSHRPSTPVTCGSLRRDPLPSGWDGIFAVTLAIFFYRKVRQRALERCSASRVQKWYRRCRAQAQCGKLIEDALAASSELMTWLMSLAQSQRHGGSRGHQPFLPEDGDTAHPSSPFQPNSSIPRYSNALQLFRFYSVAATKIQRQYRSRLRRMVMLSMIGKLIAVLKMQHWARRMLCARRLKRAAHVILTGRKILLWVNNCRTRAEEKTKRRRKWCAIHIQRWYRIGVARAQLKLLRRRNAASIEIQRVVRGWFGRQRAQAARGIAVVLKFIKAKLWYRHLAQNFLYKEVSRRLKLALSRTQSQKELERRRKAKAQQLRIYLKIDEAVVQRRAASRILGVYKGWNTRRRLIEVLTRQSDTQRQYASHSDTIAESFHSMISTSSSSAACHERMLNGDRGESVSAIHASSSTWALARQLVREYSPVVIVLQCFFRKCLARLVLLRLRYEQRTRDVYLHAWMYGAKRLRHYRRECASQAAAVFMSALRRSQERRAQERLRQEEHARQVQLHREMSATKLQSVWRMYTTQQDFREAREQHASWCAESHAAELLVCHIIGAQRLVRQFLLLRKWSRVLQRRRIYAAVKIQTKWRAILKRRVELVELYNMVKRKAIAAFKIQIWFRALVLSQRMRAEYSDDEE